MGKVRSRIKQNAAWLSIVKNRQRERERERERETGNPANVKGGVASEKGREEQNVPPGFAGTARAIDASTRFELLSLELLKSVTDTH